jgi:GTPase
VKFVDEVVIEVASGHGGPGCVSFRREKYVPRGGPDGGDGGRGGNVIFRTSTRLHSLLDLKLKTKYRAPDGESGDTQNRAGADGKDLILMVPPGTVIKTVEGQIVRDLGPDEEFIFLEGGIGGRGNPFYKSSVNQAPSVAQHGMPGKEARISLELKLLADVGIIGYPNAGKSTLISHISAAKPKVADYPFTTLIPNLGVVRIDDDTNFVVADMPGLIKDAHKGVGLGTRFLKHIERTKCFVHLIDISGVSGRDPRQDFKDINNELKMYDKVHQGEEDFVPLANRQQIIALNKIDTVDEETVRKYLKLFSGEKHKVVTISAATGKNLKELTHLMGGMVFHGEEEKETKRKIEKTIQEGPDKKELRKERLKKIAKANKTSAKIKKAFGKNLKKTSSAAKARKKK